MKTFRLLATSLLVALGMGISSCGDDDLDVTPVPPINNIEDEYTKIDKMFDEYIGDYSNITCRFCQAGESSILFTGLKNNIYGLLNMERQLKESDLNGLI